MGSNFISYDSYTTEARSYSTPLAQIQSIRNTDRARGQDEITLETLVIKQTAGSRIERAAINSQLAVPIFKSDFFGI